MVKYHSFLLIFILSKNRQTEKMKFPEFKHEDFMEDFHGIQLADPFRWLEHPDADDTKEFVEKQNAIFGEYRENLSNRNELLEKLHEVYNYPKYGCPMKHGKYYYYSHNPGLLNQSIIYQQVSYIYDHLLGFERKLFGEIAK